MKQGRFGMRGYLAIAILVLLTACGTAPYKPAPLNFDSLRESAEVQTFEPLTVKAAVPGASETEALFGARLYDIGIQPVWLEITNRGDERVRFALVSVDPDYFSPLEVSYKLRKGFSKAARKSMDQHFHRSAIGRYVQPGETISGFVFSHLSPATKSFNVDLFNSTKSQNFAFFLQVPGFLPDHAEVDFESLYTTDEVYELSTESLRDTLGDLPVNTMDADGNPNGLPINVVIVGNGRDVLRALLRAGWYETAANAPQKAAGGQAAYYLYGRRADAVFRIQRNNKVDRNELRLWLSPIKADGELVWLGQVTNFVGQRTYIETVFFGAHLDPDVDDARRFTLQNFWYSQGLQSFAFVDTGNRIAFDQPGTDFNGNRYFTDGYRAVLWLSGEPYSLLEATHLGWDELQE
jgi:hypothetical protein